MVSWPTILVSVYKDASDVLIPSQGNFMPLNQSLLSLRSLVNKFSPSHCISSVFLFFCFFKYTHWISWKFSYWPISWCNLHGQSFPLPTSALLLFELAQGTEKDTRTTYFLTNSKQFTECSVPGFVLKLHQAGSVFQQVV